MAKSSPITEAEEDISDAAGGSGNDVVDVLGGSGGPSRAPAPAADNTPHFEIVEVNSDDEPVPAPPLPRFDDGQHGAPAPAPTAPQSTDDDGQIDQNQPQFNKKWAQRSRRREGRDRTLAENRALRAEVSELRQQVEGFTKNFNDSVAPQLQRLSDSQVQHQVDAMAAQLATAERTFTEAEDRYFSALSSGDTDSARRYLRERDDAAFKRYQLLGAKEQIERNLAETRRSPQAPQAPASRFDDGQRAPGAQPARPVSPAAQAYSQDFLGELPWFNQPGAEDDTRMVLTLDNQVAQDGFDPATSEYWDELADRVSRYIPHRFGAPPAAQPARQAPQPRFAQQPQPAPQRRGPPTAAPATTPAAPRPNQVRINPERRKALEEAGVIDPEGRIVNRKKFDSIASQYVEFDRANSGGRQ